MVLITELNFRLPSVFRCNSGGHLLPGAGRPAPRVRLVRASRTGGAGVEERNYEAVEMTAHLGGASLSSRCLPLDLGRRAPSSVDSKSGHTPACLEVAFMVALGGKGRSGGFISSSASPPAACEYPEVRLN